MSVLTLHNPFQDLRRNSKVSLFQVLEEGNTVSGDF